MQPPSLPDRSDFKRVANKGHKRVCKNFVIQYTKSPLENPSLRVGFTTTKKLGNAVTRNRIRRRIRAALKETLTKFPDLKNDIVIICRYKALTSDYSELLKECNYALGKVKHDSKT